LIIDEKRVIYDRVRDDAAARTLSINWDLFVGLIPTGRDERFWSAWEYENRKPGGYDGGGSEQTRKARAAWLYRRSGGYSAHWAKHGLTVNAFTVRFVLRTRAKLFEWLDRTRFYFPYRMFRATDLDSVLSDPFGAIWFCPKCFSSGHPEDSPRYAFLAPVD